MKSIDPPAQGTDSRRAKDPALYFWRAVPQKVKPNFQSFAEISSQSFVRRYQPAAAWVALQLILTAPSPGTAATVHVDPVNGPFRKIGEAVWGYGLTHGVPGVDQGDPLLIQ